MEIIFTSFTLSYSALVSWYQINFYFSSPFETQAFKAQATFSLILSRDSDYNV